jgi:hypothetical protein
VFDGTNGLAYLMTKNVYVIGKWSFLATIKMKKTTGKKLSTNKVRYFQIFLRSSYDNSFDRGPYYESDLKILSENIILQAPWTKILQSLS